MFRMFVIFVILGLCGNFVTFWILVFLELLDYFLDFLQLLDFWECL